MMNTYLRTMIFKIDGIETKKESWVVLIDEDKAKTKTEIKGSGKTFESLWNYMQQPYASLNIPGNLWDKSFWSRKRRIEFFTKTRTWIDNNIEREWEVSFIDKPYSVSMERLMKFKSDDVIKYLQERGNSKINLVKIK